MRLFVSHLTRYRYTPAVQASEHWAHLQPTSTPTQQVLRHDLTIHPLPLQPVHSIDPWGNACLNWRLPDPHDHMEVVARTEVHTCAWPAPPSMPHWPLHEQPESLQVWTRASAHVLLDPMFAEVARVHFQTGRPLDRCAIDLCHWVHKEFDYVPQSTVIDTSVHHVFASRQGVCQDFAHLMIAMLRSLGLAAGYVSGYLLTTPPPGQPRLVGSDASHAWVRLYVPGLQDHPSEGWLHLDPTNHRYGWASPGLDYVQLAVGRDFSDVSPLRGVLQGEAQQTLEVGVTVEPLDLSNP